MTSTVIVAGNRLWLTDPDDPSYTSIVCGSRQSSAGVVSKTGVVRTYAGNQTQGALLNQSAASRAYTLVNINPAVRDQITTWIGRTLLLRTAEGVRDFVMYLSISETRVFNTSPELTDDVDYDFSFNVDITFAKVDYDELITIP